MSKKGHNLFLDAENDQCVHDLKYWHRYWQNRIFPLPVSEPVTVENPIPAHP
jgi:hypothetical protein